MSKLEWKATKGWYADMATRATGVMDRVLLTACLPETKNGDSSYFDVGRFSIRVSNHARQSHHSSSWSFESEDITVLILSPFEAEQFAEWRKEAPREVMPASVITRKPRERVKTTARKLRKILARKIFALLAEESQSSDAYAASEVKESEKRTARSVDQMFKL